jgi:DNA-binding NarL/FixJ family response regulator
VTAAPIRVLVADDHRLMAEGVRALLQGSFDIVGVAQDGVEMVALAKALDPDVVVADIGMPRLDGIAALEALAAAGVRARVLMLTMRDEGALLRKALKAGASGYVLKHAAPDELAVAIRATASGQLFVSPALAATLLEPEVPARRDPTSALAVLSDRQMQVLRLLVRGLTAAQIGEAIGVVQRTVEFHKYKMMETLGARTSADLIRIAIQSGVTVD